jgi:hypothetical protein
MTIDRKKIKYVPGTYAQRRPDAAELAEQHIHSWVKGQLKSIPQNRGWRSGDCRSSCKEAELPCRPQRDS